MDQFTRFFADLGQEAAKSEILVKQYMPSIKNATKAIIAGYTSYIIVSVRIQHFDNSNDSTAKLNLSEIIYRLLRPAQEYTRPNAVQVFPASLVHR